MENDSSTRSPLRTFVFAAARALGLFALSRRIYRSRQCILCYHAFSYEDEHAFRPQLYMRPSRFAARLDLLRRRGYRVIALQDATERLGRGAARLDEVAITIDDGFTSVHAFAAPALRARDMPATLYLTTYYVERPRIVFTLALQYLAWKCGRATAELELSRFGLDIADPVPLRGDRADAALEAIVAAAEARLDEDERERLLRHIAARLGVSLDPIVADRRFHLVTPEMLRELAAAGFDIELHTHRHRFPDDARLLARELDDNRASLARLGIPTANHLCYPSGEWRESAFPTLEAAGVRTATTCAAGLNDRHTHPLALRRFLDADDIAEVEFEAEISGFKQLLRDAAGALRSARPS